MRLWPLLLCLAACAGAPTAAPEGERLLAEAEQALADGDVQAAKDLLLDREEDDFPPAQQARFASACNKPLPAPAAGSTYGR